MSDKPTISAEELLVLLRNTDWDEHARRVHERVRKARDGYRKAMRKRYR